MDKLPSPTERKRLAELAGINEQFLYQCLTGRGTLSASEAVRVEEATNFELRRWDLRPKDWFDIWPELINARGAPAIKRTAKQRRMDERRRAALSTAEPRADNEHAAGAEHRSGRDRRSGHDRRINDTRRTEDRRER